MANATSTQLQELYVAYFGRAADPTGLDYWTEKGISKADFAAKMHAQPEFDDAYGDDTTEAQVNQIYKNLFDREADVTGLTYWTQEINLGNLKLAEIANHLIWAAQNNEGSEDDKTALTNRTDAAVAYTAKVKETTAGILAYAAESADPWVSGDNINEAIDYMSGIDKDTEYTDAGIEASVDVIVDNGEPGTGSTFALTTETDDLTGTSAADTFTGGVSTMSGSDEISGGGGDDTLTVRMDANDVMGIIDGVETIEIIARGDNGGAAISFLDVDDVEDVVLKDGSTNFDFDDFDKAVDLTFKSADEEYNIEYADIDQDLDVQDLTVNDFDGTFVIGTTGLETINITGAVTASEFTLTDHATETIETINIDGSADVNLTLAAATNDVNTIDASAATGDTTITASAAAMDLTITTGTGDDTIELGTTIAAADDIDMGEGDDELEGEINATTTTRIDAIGVETADFNFSAAGTLDLRNTDSVTTLDLSGSTAAMDVNRASSKLTDVIFTTDSDADYDIDYAAGAATALTVTIGDADDDDADGAAVDTGDFTTDATSLTIASVGESDNTVDTVTANDATSISITTSTTDGDLTVGNLTATDLTSLTLSAVAGDLTVGTLTDADKLTSLVLEATGVADLEMGDMGDTTDPGAGALFALESITATVETGNLTLGTMDVGTDDDDGSALSSISITSAGESVQLAAAGVFVDGNSLDEDADLDSVDFTLTGDDVDGDIGDINAAEIDEINITASGEDGTVLFDHFQGTAIGDVNVTAGEDTDIEITGINGSEIGDITVTAADDSTITLNALISTGTIGNITLDGDGTFDIDIHDVSTSMGDIDAATDTTDESTVNIDVGNASMDVAPVVNFGEGTNTYSAAHTMDDEINLEEDEGTDTINMNTTLSGNITIDEFENAGGGDVIELSRGGIQNMLPDGTNDSTILAFDATSAAATGNVVLQETTGALDADDQTTVSNILVLDDTTSELSALSDVETAICNGGDFALTLGAALNNDQSFMVLWDDGTSSYLTQVTNTSNTDVADGATMVASDIELETVVTFTGITDATTFTAADLGTAWNT